LFFLSWIASRRFDSDTFLKRLNSAKKYFTKNISFKITVISFTIFLIFLYGYFPNYWKYPQPPISDYQMTGMTKEGYPWIGSENPKLTIDEYTDYQCFQCYKIHYTLRKIIAKNKYSIRLIHHHYPMDHEVNAVVVPSDFHNGSGKLAKMAILASLRNKFWQFNDLLYSKIRTNSKEISLKELSDATDLDINELTASLSDPTIDELLRRDIWKGMKLGLTGTPSFVINGKVYQGYIPPEIIQSITR
jgi:protein-disulfide isomerase